MKKINTLLLVLTSLNLSSISFSHSHLVSNNIMKTEEQDPIKTVLFLGNSSDGQKIKTTNLKLKLENSEDKAEIQIENWILNYDGKSISGKGNTLSEAAIEAILNSKKGTKIILSTISNTKKVTNATFIR
jgi:hypothetical protein